MSEPEILTEEELSALLPAEKPNAQSAAKTAAIELYNFRRPNRLPKEQVRTLYGLHDAFAQTLSSQMPVFLRAFGEVNLISVEQQTYSEYLRGLCDPTTVFTVSMQPLAGFAALELSPAIAFPIVDRMLGGSGQSLKESRAATDIEIKILNGFLQIVAESLSLAWKPFAAICAEIAACETRPQMLQIVQPNEIVAVFAFQIAVGEQRGTMNLCLPLAMLEPIAGKFSRAALETRRASDAAQTAALLKTLEKTAFPIAAELEKAPISTQLLMSLQPGDVLQTAHRLEQPVVVRVGNVPKFAGNLAACDGRVVVQISGK